MDVLHRASLPSVQDADDEGSESSSFGGNSDDSMFSSTDLADDAASPSPASAASNASQGPLYQLSSLMDELPIKRGLSKYFQGKSESFTSLSDAKCIADLRKKSPCIKRTRTCRNYKEAAADITTRPWYAPGLHSKTITKKPSRSSCSLLARRSSSSALLYGRKTQVHVHRNP